MSFKKSPDAISENNTLELLNWERIKMIKSVLERQGRALQLSDAEAIRYLTDIPPELHDVHLLGTPDEIMPDHMTPETNRKTLYMFESEDEANRLEKMLMGLGVSEKNLIASMRCIYLYFEQMMGCPERFRQALATQVMEPTLKERIIFLAGKYDFEVSEAWTRKMSRERISELLIKGVYDPDYAGIDDALIRTYENEGKTMKDLENDIAFINQSNHRNTSLFLQDFLRRRPDPAQYACQLLNTAGLQSLVTPVDSSIRPN